MPGYVFTVEPVVALIEKGVQISWEANCEGGGQVLVGFNEHELKNLFYDGFVDKSHSIEVKNLQPGKTYFFRVSNIDEDGTPLIQSKVSSFTVSTS